MFRMPSCFNVGDVIPFPFGTFDADGGSVTITGLAVTDIEPMRFSDEVERTSDNGYTLVDTDGIDVKGRVGIHGFKIDTSDNSHAGFWVDGETYQIVVDAVTVDGQTVRFVYLLALGFSLRPTTAGRTLDVNATGEAGLDLDNTSGTLAAAQFGADFLTAAKIADGAFVADNFAASSLNGKGDWNTVTPDAAGVLPTAAENADAVWDEDLTGNTHNDPTTAGRRLRQANLGQAIANEGTAQAGGANTITLADAAEDTVDDLYHEAWVSISEGTGAGQVRFILTYDASERLATVHADWEVNPANDSVYIVHGNAASNLHAIEDETQSVIDFKDFVDTGYNPSTHKVQGVVLTDTITTYTGNTKQTGDNYARIGVNGAGLTNIDLPDQTMDITGSLSGSVGSVSGAVGSVAGNVDGSVASVVADVTTDGPSRSASKATGFATPTNVTDAHAITDGKVDAVAADLPVRPTKNVAYANFKFPMVLTSDHVTGATGLTVTAQRSIDDGAFANCANAVVEISAGWYRINLAASDLNGDSIAFTFTADTADARLLAITTQST